MALVRRQDSALQTGGLRRVGSVLAATAPGFRRLLCRGLLNARFGGSFLLRRGLAAATAARHLRGGGVMGVGMRVMVHIDLLSIGFIL
tara:strand:- start:11730 stop:11993 length:264 start_codon:yes stop_codon:yes gene_type:complete